MKVDLIVIKILKWLILLYFIAGLRRSINYFNVNAL